MIAATLIVIMLVVIGSAILAVLTTVAVSSLVQAHRIRREPSVEPARLALVAALSGDDSRAMELFPGLDRFSRRSIIATMLDLAPSVKGTSRLVLVSLGEQIGVLEQARRGVHGRRWSVRLYSARVLTAFGVESESLLALFSDRAPEVRTQAATWCAATPSSQGIACLVAQLADRDGQCRFAAQDALIRIGLPVFEALMGALDSASAEVAVRILIVAAAVGDERSFGRVEALVSDPSSEVRALSAAVLASTGSPEAGSLLVTLLDDDSDEVVLAAAAGLARLCYWPAAASVERVLSHTSWELRRQAIVTLSALGAPGLILLRAQASDRGPAADMASQALQQQTLSAKEKAA
ncbi:MAG: HEAT repeat domain-containing protein [Acidimicrobiales bacterium]|jgi:hypothetical protein